MALPDGIWFVCPECGVSNRPGATACYLCGHGLATVWTAARTGGPKSPTSHTRVNPYAAPTDFAASGLSFRISSLLLVIALIAVCLGVAHENWFLGISLAVAVTPALVYTFIVAAKRKARGRPMATLEKVGSFLGSLVGVVVILVSAIIAFFVTCFSFAAASQNVILALVTGGTMAALAAAFITYYLLTRISRRGGRPW